MITAARGPSHPLQSLVRNITLALTLLLSGLLSQAQADVRLPHGEYFLNVDDLSVKVLGGHVTAKRTWYQGAWTFNRAWEPLKLEQDTLSGEIKVIERNGDRYEQENGGTTYRFGRRYSIHTTESGLRWQDRQGNWIDYESNGRISAYGDRNNLEISFQFNEEGRRSNVLGPLGNLLLSYQYDTEGRLRFIRDRAANTIEYRYNGTQLSEVIDPLGNSWVIATATTE